MTLHERVEIDEARLLIRWAASNLNDTERHAIMALLSDTTLCVAAQDCGLTRGGVWMAQKAALRKMRKRLRMLGITGSGDVCSRDA